MEELMGPMQRRKGKTFERVIAAKLRDRWPNAIVRRASQAERADQADVFVEGHPVLERCWLEMQDARNPQPNAKLDQAERDVRAFHKKRDPAAAERLPVVIWHRLAERSIWATTRLWVIGDLAKWRVPYDTKLNHVTTLELDDFLDLVSRCEVRGGL